MMWSSLARVSAVRYFIKIVKCHANLYICIIGLYAANVLMENGVNDFVVLEARDRVGGRTFTEKVSLNNVVFCQKFSLLIIISLERKCGLR